MVKVLKRIKRVHANVQSSDISRNRGKTLFTFMIKQNSKSGSPPWISLGHTVYQWLASGKEINTFIICFTDKKL